MFFFFNENFQSASDGVNLIKILEIIFVQLGNIGLNAPNITQKGFKK